MGSLDELLGNLPDKGAAAADGAAGTLESTLANLPDKGPRPVMDSNESMISRAPQESWWEAAKRKALDFAETFPAMSSDRAQEERRSRSYAALSLRDHYAGQGIALDLSDIEANLDKFTRSAEVRPGVVGLGTRRGLTYEESVQLGMGALIATGLGSAPVATLVGLAGFEALGYIKGNALEQSRKAYLNTLDLFGVGTEGDPIANRRTHVEGTYRDLKGFLPETASTPLKALLDAFEFAGIGKVGMGLHGPAKLAARNAFEAATHNVITEIKAPERVFIAPEKIKSIFQSGDKISAEEADLVSSLGLTAKQYRAAMDYGLTVEVPTAKLTRMVEKPWWGRVRELFKISPYEAYTARPEAMGETRGTVAVPALPEGTGTLSASEGPAARSATVFQAKTETTAPQSPEPGPTPEEIAATPLAPEAAASGTPQESPDMTYLAMQNEAQARALESALKRRDAQDRKSESEALARFKESEDKNPVARLSKLRVNYESAERFFGRQALEGVPPGRLVKSGGVQVDLAAREHGVEPEQVLEALFYTQKSARERFLEQHRTAVRAERSPALEDPFGQAETETVGEFVGAVERLGGLSRAQVTANYPPEVVAILEAGKLLSDKGVLPEVVVRALGYADERAMFDAVSESLSGRLTAEQAVRAQLEMSDSVARYSLDSEEYAAYLDEQVKILERMLNAPRTNAKPRILGQDDPTVGELEIDERTALEAALKRAERAARDAFRSGNIEGALAEKELQQAMVRRALARRRMRREVAEIKSELEKAADNDKLPLEYRDQIAAILDGVDIRRAPKTQRKLDSLSDFLAREEAKGEDTSYIPVELIDRLQRRPLNDFDIQELRDLRESVARLVHLGTLKNKLVASKTRRDFNTLANELAASIVEKARLDAETLAGMSPDEPLLREARPSLFGMVKGAVSDGMAKLIGPEFIIRAMDGFKQDGPAHEALWEANKAANDAELLRLEQHRAAMERILKPVLDEGRAFFSQRHSIPGVRGLYTKEEAVSVALSSQRPVNIRHLVNGNRIKPEEIKAIADWLEPKYREMVNQIWDYNESLFPDIDKNQIALTGQRLKKTAGRYYPAAINWQMARRGDRILEQVQNGKDAYEPQFFVRPGTRASFRQDATGGDQPLRLDLNVWVKHLMDEATDTTRTLVARDVAKILLDERVKQAVVLTRGEGEYRALVDWLKTQRDLSKTPQDRFLRLGEMLRNNMTASQLALNIANVLQQPFSLLNVFSEPGVGVADVAAALGEYAANPRAMTQFAASRSVELRARINTKTMEADRDMAALAKSASQLDRGVLDAARRLAFLPTVIMDQVATVPAWLIGYRKGMLAYAGDEAKAIAYADSLMARTQSSGDKLHRPEVLNKQGLTRFFTMFMTWQMNYMNQFREVAARTWAEPSAVNVAQAAKYVFWAVVMQQVLTAPLKYGRMPEKKEIAGDIATAPLRGVPLLGNFVNPMARILIGNAATPYSATPLERIPQTMLDIGTAMRSKTPEARTRALLDALELGSYATGLPTKPISGAVRAVQEKRRSGKGNALNLIVPRQREPRN